MIRRYVSAIAIGLLVTLGVLYIMPKLIAARHSLPEEPATAQLKTVAWVPAKVEPKPPKPEPLPKPAPVPPSPFGVNVDPPGPKPTPVPIPPVPHPVPHPGPPTPSPLDCPRDQPLVARLKLDPIYNLRAKQRGIEGYCLVEYTVTPRGTVEDVVVIDSEPQGYFEKDSIKAAQQYRYQPLVVNCKPIATRIQTKIEFRLNGSDSRER